MKNIINIIAFALLMAFTTNVAAQENATPADDDIYSPDEMFDEGDVEGDAVEDEVTPKE